MQTIGFVEKNCVFGIGLPLDVNNRSRTPNFSGYAALHERVVKSVRRFHFFESDTEWLSFARFQRCQVKTDVTPGKPMF